MSSPTEKLDAIWARLEPTNNAQTSTEDVPALIDALRAVLTLADRWDRVHASMEDYHASDVRAVIEEALP